MDGNLERRLKDAIVSEFEGMGEAWTTDESSDTLAWAAARVVARMMMTTPPESVNYEALLRKYINHVGECEGSTFLSPWRDRLGGLEWTDEEWKVLTRLEREAFPDTERVD